MILTGAVLAFQDFTIPRTPYDVDILIKNIFTIMCSFLGSGIAMFLLFKYMPGMPFFHRLVLTASETTKSGFVISSQPAGGSDLTGKKGKAITTLHPTGKIEVNNHTLDVVTDGEFIEKGQSVEIIEIRGNRIVVRAAIN